MMRGARSHQLVTFAGRAYEALPIKYRHLPSAALDQAWHKLAR
jgi:hypothetical protein